MCTACLLTVVGCPGVCVSRLSVCPGEVCASRKGVCWGCAHPPPDPEGHPSDPEAATPRTKRQTPPPPHVDRQTPVKTLPCPKFRLWTVNMICRPSIMERLNRVPRMYSLCFGYSRLPLSRYIILSVKVKGP